MFSSEWISIIGADNAITIRKRDIYRVVQEFDTIEVWFADGDGEQSVHIETFADTDYIDDLTRTLNGDDPTPPPADAPRILEITRVTRGETSNSGSPLWRCYDADGTQVNIFQHTDPLKNNYDLLALPMQEIFDGLNLGDELDLSRSPIKMWVEKDGKWNSLVAVDRRWLPPQETPTVDPSDLAALDAIRNTTLTDDADTDALSQTIQQSGIDVGAQRAAPTDQPDDDDGPPPIDYDHIPPGSLAPDAS